MLWQKLISATAAKKSLEFVGGAAFSNSTSDTPVCSLTGLSGGLDTAPSAGDIVVACIAFNNTTDRNIQVTFPSGFTEVADLFTLNCQLGVYYKVLTAAETSVVFNIGVTAASHFTCHVWRNQNSTPLDATTATAQGIQQAPNAPAITTLTDNSVAIAIGAYTGNGAIMSAPSGMENFYTTSVSSVTAGIGIASFNVAPAGLYDPPAFSLSSIGNSNRFCAATLALRPA